MTMNTFLSVNSLTQTEHLSEDDSRNNCQATRATAGGEVLIITIAILEQTFAIPAKRKNSYYFVEALEREMRACSLVVSDLRFKGSRFESGCQLCGEVSSLQ